MLKRQNFSSSLRCALNGFWVAYKEEPNFKTEIFFAILIPYLGYHFGISTVEFLIITLTIGFVLATELLNTALEEICDKFHPEHDPRIEKIKDLAAAAVLVSSVSAVIVGLIILGPYTY
ncbi:MAG TPA: diacylglycerol kinase family protein [Candidatus Paceibacterota bacterium]|nr:diacylglycerol kinase family protein [Candidatus Paceibacterota bacterium]